MRPKIPACAQRDPWRRVVHTGPLHSWFGARGPQATSFAAVHERCLQLAHLWPANATVLQLLWEQWRQRKFAHPSDDDDGVAATAIRSGFPPYLATYAGGSLPALPTDATGSTVASESAFHLFLRLVAVQFCAPATASTSAPTPAAADALSRDKTWTRLVSGYDGPSATVACFR